MSHRNSKCQANEHHIKSNLYSKSQLYKLGKISLKIMHFEILNDYHRISKMYSKCDNIHHKYMNCVFSYTNNHLIASIHYMV